MLSNKFRRPTVTSKLILKNPNTLSGISGGEIDDTETLGVISIVDQHLDISAPKGLWAAIGAAFALGAATGPIISTAFFGAFQWTLVLLSVPGGFYGAFNLEYKPRFKTVLLWGGLFSILTYFNPFLPPIALSFCASWLVSATMMYMFYYFLPIR